METSYFLYDTFKFQLSMYFKSYMINLFCLILYDIIERMVSHQLQWFHFKQDIDSWFNRDSLLSWAKIKFNYTIRMLQEQRSKCL